MPTAVRLAELVAALGGALHGDGSLPIQRLAPLESADAGSMSFLANPRYATQLATTGASCSPAHSPSPAASSASQSFTRTSHCWA